MLSLHNWKLSIIPNRADKNSFLQVTHSPKLYYQRRNSRYYGREDLDKRRLGELIGLTLKADRMTVTVEVQAESQKGFDALWLRNAVEEPLDETDINASTRLK